jgi:hypothetical protein
MRTRSICISLTLLLALSSRSVLAEHESPDAHKHGDTKTVTLDNKDIRPSDLKMRRGDVLSFVNSSTHPMHVEFTEPEGMADKIRCGLVRDAKAKGAPAAPWALFTWSDGKLAGQIPPGKFASVCSLAPGHYAYTIQRIGHAAGTSGPGPKGLLPDKGQIDVE